VRDVEADKARKRALYARRKAAGLCASCGCVLLPEWDRLCPECHARTLASLAKYGKTKRGKRRSKRWRKKRRALLRDELNRKEREWRTGRKVLGLCERCKAVADDGNYCARHAEVARAAARRHANQKHAAWKEAGLCVRCGRERDRASSVCSRCRAYGNRHRRVALKRQIADRRRRGLCTACGGATTPDYRQCERCRKYNRERAIRYRAAKEAA
jgi:hypothetical protein